MKKTNNVKANKVNENAKVNNTKATKANNVAKQTKTANTKIDAKLLTVKPHEGCSVTFEDGTIESMKSWAYHVTRDLSDFFISLNDVVDAGETPTIDPYTEDQINEMIAQAGFAINFFDPNDTEIYRDYYNAYGCCRYIMERCVTLTHILHGNYDGLGWVKPKYKHSELPINIEIVYHRLYNEFYNTRGRDMFARSYTRDELYSISGKASRTLDVLDRYDCSDICNVEVTKYFCNEVINIVNDLLDVIANSISGKDNKTNTAIGYDEYDDF